MIRIKKGYIEILLFLAVYIFALGLWSEPIQEYKTPYGEFDAISHWELADTIAQQDRTFVSLPPFLKFSYGEDNKYKPGTLWYHPPFHTNLAIISAFTGDRVVPIFFTNAVFATAIMISVFFVVRQLFGFLPAILSAFLLSFSMRDILPFIWGQWPERFGYAFIPLILYCWYKYYLSYSKEDSKPIYLYLLVIFLAVSLMIHPLSFFHSLVTLAVLAVFLAAKKKKIHFNIKHMGIAAVIFIALFAAFPYQSGNVIVSFIGSGEADDDVSIKESVFERLLQWAPSYEYFQGSVPPSYFSFRDMHGQWTLPLLILGIAVLIFRRKEQDLFLLAWLVGLYIILHRDLFDKFFFLHRSLSATAHIFVPITAVGLLSVASLIKLPKKIKLITTYGLAIVFVVLVFQYNLPPAKSTLESAYESPFARLNDAQIEVSEWLQNTIPEDQNVSVIGPPEQLAKKVWWMSSYSHRTSFYFEGFLKWSTYEENRNETIQYHLENDYVLFDYSDIGRIQDQSLAQQWLAFEQEHFSEETIVYNKDSIRVHKK